MGRVQAFVERCNVLVSGSKDGYVRAWDLGTQHCFQTALGAQGEVRAQMPGLLMSFVWQASAQTAAFHCRSMVHTNIRTALSIQMHMVASFLLCLGHCRLYSATCQV